MQQKVYNLTPHMPLQGNPTLTSKSHGASLPCSTLSQLSQKNQEKFVVFGQGQTVTVAYSAIHHAIEQQCIDHPESIAATYNNEQINYRELNRKADFLATELASLGIGKGDNVGIFIERSITMLVGILAILKTGAAYVPQDARITPIKTLSKIIDLALIKCVLSLTHLEHEIPKVQGVKILYLDQQQARTQGCKQQRHITFPKRDVNEQDNCFILFTSGTTGKPNGVMVNHGNICNILLTEPGNLGIKPGYKVAQLLNVAFDMASWEILACLSQGGTLLIRGKNFTKTAQQCDIIVATPSILSTIDADACFRVKTVAVAGEPCPFPLAEKWATKCCFYNAYGPTETTIVNTAQNYTPQSQHLTIGRPTPNNTIYILDEHRQPKQIGEIGEIWAGGAGITSGYINNDPLTNERYIPDPFANDGRMMFRTRDLGRWNEKGELECFGRVDDQVKIKGFRVELDAISSVLETVNDCQQAVTLKCNDQTLITFVRPAQVSIKQCQQAIADTLPYYCHPSMILPMPQFPMTARGKIDKRALLEIATSKLTNQAGSGATI